MQSACAYEIRYSSLQCHMGLQLLCACLGHGLCLHKSCDTSTGPWLALQFAALKQCQKMLGMYVNRVNGAWAEAQAWGAPEAATCNELAAWSKGDQYLVYKADVM